VNNEQFIGVVCKEDRKRIWKEIGRNLDELRQISFKKQSKRNSQILYKLKEPVLITEIFKKPEIEIELKTGSKTDTYLIYIADVEVELGKIVTVTAFKTINLEPEDIAEWVELYGFVQGKIRSELNLV